MNRYAPVERSEVGDATHAGDPARMGDRGADIIDELFFNKLLAVPDAVEDFTDGNRGHRVLTDQSETLLVLGRRRIFHPEKAIIFNAFTKARRFYGCQAVVHVVKEMLVKAERIAHRLEQFRREIKILFRRPQLLFRPLSFRGGFIGLPFSLCHAVGGFHTARRTEREWL